MSKRAEEMIQSVGRGRPGLRMAVVCTAPAKQYDGGVHMNMKHSVDDANARGSGSGGVGDVSRKS